MTAYVRKSDGTWQPITNDQPLNIRMPDGSWMPYGDSGVDPLKMRLSDGTWKDILFRVAKGPLWYRGDDLLPTGADGASVTSWPHHVGGFGPTLTTPPGLPGPGTYGFPPRRHIGVNGQAAVQSWTTDPSSSALSTKSWTLEGVTSGYTTFPGYKSATGMTSFLLMEYSGPDDGHIFGAGLFNAAGGPSAPGYMLWQPSFHGVAGNSDFEMEGDDLSFWISEPVGPPTTLLMVEWRFGSPSGTDLIRFNGVDYPDSGYFWEAFAPDGITPITSAGMGGVTVNDVQVGANGNQVTTNVYEFILFDKILVDPEPDPLYPSLSDVRSYFATRYGITTLC